MKGVKKKRVMLMLVLILILILIIKGRHPPPRLVYSEKKRND